jgi:hypothetical protein
MAQLIKCTRCGHKKPVAHYPVVVNMQEGWFYTHKCKQCVADDTTPAPKQHSLLSRIMRILLCDLP